MDRENRINKSICNLLLEKDKFKELWKEAKGVCEAIDTKQLYSIGAPLNDNCLKFNKEQLRFLLDIAKQIKEVL